MTTGKTIALTKRTFVGKVMSLRFNMQSMLVIIFLPRSKCLLISWLQSPSAVILEPRKIKSTTVSIVSPSICHEVMGLDIMILVFWIPKKGSAKECSNYCAVALISHASKVMLKILQARLQQYMNREHPDVQAGFRKGRGTRDQIANIRRVIKKAREFQKKSALLTMPKPFTFWITVNCGKFWKRWEYQTTWPASWETYLQVMKQQLELNMEKQTGSK